MVVVYEELPPGDVLARAERRLFTASGVFRLVKNVVVVLPINTMEPEQVFVDDCHTPLTHASNVTVGGFGPPLLSLTLVTENDWPEIESVPLLTTSKY